MNEFFNGLLVVALGDGIVRICIASDDRPPRGGIGSSLPSPLDDRDYGT